MYNMLGTTKMWTRLLIVYWILMDLSSTICAESGPATPIASGNLHGPCNESPTSAPCHTLHSICVNHTCQCASPYSPRNGVCYFSPGEASVNNSCASNIDCQGQGEFCNYGYCRCLRTHVEIDRHCLPVIYPGQLGCDDSRQCAAAFPGAVCRNRYCECPGGSMAQGQTCVTNGDGLTIGDALTSASTATSTTTTPAPSHFQYEVAEVGSSVASRRAAAASRSLGARGVINYQAIQPQQGPPQQQQQGVVNSGTGFGTVPPGGVCSQDQECAGSPFAYCMSTCMCREGAINAGSTCLEPGSTSRGNCGTGQVYVSEAGACMNIARPGEPCQYSQQCSGTEVGAFCVNLKCRCVYGMVVTGDGRCSFVNSNCTTRGTVWISEVGECKPVIAPGARTCTHRQQCLASYQDSMCFLTQCTCPEGKPVAVDGTCGTSCSSGHTFSGVLGKCVPTVQPGDRCQYSSQCHAIYPGMMCDKGICRCPNNQMWTGSACSASCPVGYMMNPKSGMCRPQCRPTQIDVDGECLDTVGPDQPCRVNQQCQGGAICTNRVCLCPQGTQNMHGTCSRASSAPGGQCNLGEYCTGGSYCDNGICACPMGTVKSNTQCITPANVPPNSRCGPAAQCSGNSVCINGACQCPEGQIAINGFCAIPPSVPPGYPCSLSDRCTLGSTCQNGICQCPTGTLLSENRCLVPMQVPPGSSCRTGAELCTGLSVCTANGICTCPNGMFAQGAICRTPGIAPPSSSCANKERCTGGAECIGNVCMCPPGTKNINMQCQFMASVPPNFSCANGENCIGGSECQDGICRCPAGQAAFNQVCQYSSAGVGSPCMTNAQCTGGSTCVANACTCRNGQIWSNGACVTANTVPPGARCHSLAICVGRSRCVNGLCSCDRGQVAARDQCIPIRVLPPNSYCSLSAIDEQCTGGSSCVNGTCQCPRSMRAFREECVNVRRVPPDAACNPGDMCTGGSMCQNGVCRCPEGLVVTRNQECGAALRVAPGNPCPTGTEICTGGSSCSGRRICDCPSGQTIQDQYCSTPPQPMPLVPYNFLCVHDGECVGGASCLGGVCICPNSTLLVDGICQSPAIGPPPPRPSPANLWPPPTPWPRPRGYQTQAPPQRSRTPPGAQCTPGGAECGGGSVCISNVCACPPSYEIVNGACRPTATVPPQSSCANGERCGGGSRCVQDVCKCTDEQVVIGNQCQEKPIVNYDPFAARRRPQSSPSKDPLRGRRSIREYAPPAPKPGELCSPTEKCLGGASCREGVCKCQNGTSLVNERCVAMQAGRMANPGEPCSAMDVCTGGSYCQGGMCVCPPGRGVQGFTCMTLVVGPGFSCANAERCCGGSKCVAGVCACPAGMVITDDLVQCQPAVMINRANPGQPCDFGTICNGGSWCQNNLCTCPTGQTTQFNMCIGEVGLSVPPGATCNLEGQTACGGGSFCAKEQCSCEPGLIVQNQMCVTPGSTNTAFPSQQCDFGTICTGGSVCQRGFCACLPGQTVQNQMCSGGTGGGQFAPPGGHCTLGVTTCTGGSFCSSGLCVCQGGQVVENQMCVFGTGVPPGSPCLTSQTACGGGSFCINNICTCPQGQAIMNGMCTGAGGQVTAVPGQACDFATSCLGGSFCQNNRCMCPPGQMVINMACRSSGAAAVVPGNPCTAGLTQCGGGSTCANGICSCPTGQVVQNMVCGSSWTSEYAPPGSWCNTTTKCTGGSTCNQNVCTCPTGQSVENAMCIPPGGIGTVPPGGSCAGMTAACTGGSYCNNGICACPTGTYANEGQCNRQPGNWAFPGQPCLPSMPCIGGSTCIGGICTCPPNQVIAHNECVQKQSTVLPGLACDANSICLGDSSCVNGVCHCPPGQMAENGQCIMRHNAVPPGYPCTPGVHMCIGGSFCMGDRCTCATGQVIVNDQCTSLARGQTRDPQNPDEGVNDNSTEVRAPIAGREVPPGADCLADGTGCIGGSSCMNGKCVCGQGQIVLNGACSINPMMVPPGSSCEASNVCPSCKLTCGGGSTCIFGSCVCLPGQTVQNGQCVSLQPAVSQPPPLGVAPAAPAIAGQLLQPGVPGAPCAEPGAVCTGGSACKNSMCACPEGAVANSAMQCVPSFGAPPIIGPAGTGGAELGAQCIPGQTQCAHGAICSKDNLCACPDGMQPQNGQCSLPSGNLGSELFGGGSGFLPPGSPCAIGNTTTSAGGAALSGCGFGSTCAPPGVCTCPVGLKASGGRCVPMSASGNFAPPGAPCIIGTTACGGSATCVNGLCTCAETEVITDGVCLKTASAPPPHSRENLGVAVSAARGPSSIPPGAACPSGAGAPASICTGGALCINDVCTCPLGTVASDLTCVGENGSVLPGNGCIVGGPACMGGATCLNGICLCPQDQEPYGERCVQKWKTVPPASPCAESRSCGGGSYCFNGLCTCPPGHSIQNAQCVLNDSTPRKLRDLIEKSASSSHLRAPPGSWCGGAVLCNGGSYCYNNVCTCPFGQLIVNLQCAEAPIVPPGSSCLNGEQCGGGSNCAQGKCTCPSGTTQSGKSCKNVFMSARTQTCPLPDNPSACALPECYCSRNGTQIPGNFTNAETPQMIVLTIDDALNGRTMNYLRQLFDGRFKNPNGCEVKATFFVSHEWNNYDEVQWLYYNGHEIAVNSITHQTLSHEPVDRWSSEMSGMRQILQQLSALAPEAIKGVRAPQLAPGGNSQFEMMRQDGFQYDNSMSANPGKDGPAYWPQTLDFQLPWRCEVEPCPDRSFPGLWVIPINQFFGYYLPEIQEHKRGAMVRAAMADAPEETVDTLFNMLLDNFNRVYRTNRAPYVITLDAAFFQTLPNNGSMEALDRFLNQALRTPDVWIVNHKQVLDWMRRPTQIGQINSFAPWQCVNEKKPENAAPCRTPQRCTYQTQLPFGERWFKTCMTCPAAYPWLNNPTGTRRK